MNDIFHCQKAYKTIRTQQKQEGKISMEPYNPKKGKHPKHD